MKNIKPFSDERRYENWDDVPHVILKKHLLMCNWFRNFAGTAALKTSLHDGATTFDIKDFGPNLHNRYPKAIEIEMKYKNESITILVVYDTTCAEYDRYAVTLREPYIHKYQSNSYRHGWRRYFNSKSVQGALKRIEEAFNDGCLTINEKIAIEENYERIKKERKEQAAAISKELDVEIKLSENSDLLIYGNYDNAKKEYCLVFKRTKDELFNIKSITGEYTLDEIKTIVNVVGGNPRAIVARLQGR